MRRHYHWVPQHIQYMSLKLCSIISDVIDVQTEQTAADCLNVEPFRSRALRVIHTNGETWRVENARKLLLDESWPRCLQLMRSVARCRAGRQGGGRRWRKGGGRRGALARLLPVPQNVQRLDPGRLDGAVAAATTGRLANGYSVGPLEGLVRSGSTSQAVRSIGDRLLVEMGYKIHIKGSQTMLWLFEMIIRLWKAPALTAKCVKSEWFMISVLVKNEIIFSILFW